jgi:hypothetical protein
MPVQSGRVITDTTQGAFNRDSRKEIEQIKREIVKPKAAAPVTAGSMQGFTRAKSFSTVWSTASASCHGWDFDSTWDTSPADKPTLILSTDTATFGPAEAGWYVTHHFATTFAVAGALARINFGTADSGVDQRSYGGRTWLPGTYDGETVLDHWSGPFWLPATTSGREPLGLDFQFATLGAAPSGLWQANIDVWRVG